MNDQNEKKHNSVVEQEYLRMMNEETPDLWNRIEAGLDDSSYQDDSSFYEPEEVKQGRRPRYGIIIPGIAVAAVVLFISIFALTGGFDRKKNADRTDTANNETAAFSMQEKAEDEVSGRPGTEASAEMDGQDDDDSNKKGNYSADIRTPEQNAAESMPEPENEAEAENDVISESSESEKLTGNDKKEFFNSNTIRDSLTGERKGESELIESITGVVDKETFNADRANADTGKGTPKVLKAGDKAPDFTIDLYGGGTFHLSDYDDQIVVLDLWATWCSTCINELPAFQKLDKEGIEGVKVICVELGDPENEVGWVVSDYGLSVNVGLDKNGKVTRYYPAEYIPYTLVIDHGVIAEVIDVYGQNEVYNACKEAIAKCRN